VPPDLIDAFLALGNTLQLLPGDAINEADRQEVAKALEELIPALELASSNALDRFDAVFSAKYASASARLSAFTQDLGVRQNSERQALMALIEVIKLSVQKLYERQLEPIEAGRILDLVKRACETMQGTRDLHVQAPQLGR